MSDVKTGAIGAVLVVGAGVAGMQASLDLADSGYLVHLADRSPAIGGIMSQLDKTFPTNDCAMCIISPKLVEVGRHPNIRIYPGSEVEALEGKAGCFKPTLATQPRFIDLERCTACGQCRQVCPASAINEFNQGIDRREATFMRYPQAIPRGYGIDRASCLGCGLCEKVCLAQAVRYDDQPRRTALEVGAVILAPGNEVFDPSNMDTYPYRDHPNVVTSLEFERILSASGPYRGHLMRPYDREEPTRIAWLQCVGSRDLQHCDNAYCSGVCCMYAIKEAVIAMEHAQGKLDTAIFFMDMRTYGKDFEHFYNRARDEHGVRFIRSRVHSVTPVGDGDLSIAYGTESGSIEEEIFNMVVLSVGFEVGRETIALSQRLGIEINENRFARTTSFAPVETSREGIYVCGTFQGPKDIPQSVMEASAAVAASSTLLSEARWTQAAVPEKPVEVDVRGEPPRIGVFVCQCGINIGGVVDVPAVREYAKGLPHVVYVEDNLYTCSQDTQVKMCQVIKEQGINRVIVAACTPSTHEPLFRETLVSAGRNKYLFEMANIRNHDSWVHQGDPVRATQKAKDLVRMAVAKAALLEPLEEPRLSITRGALVIGGGVAGMVAARALADLGYPVHLAERGAQLGGQARSLFKTWRGEDIRRFVDDLAQTVLHHPRVTVHLASTVTQVEGFVGNFRSTLGNGTDPVTVEHGVAIIATGGKEHRPEGYLYGQDPRVLTHQELDERFAARDPFLSSVESAVFIQCVGSREPERPYCSRVCCTHTVESALELKRLNPAMDVFVLYRDLRTYGERELLYQEARRAGVLFVRYTLENKPLVEEREERLRVTVFDPILQRQVVLSADLMVLASAVIPNEARQLSQFFKIPVTAENFFLEAHAKLRPVDFATDGVYVCGLAHYPKSIDESIAQAQAAAARAAILLARDSLALSGTVASSNPNVCSGCGVCVNICPFSAPRFMESGRDAGKAEINPALCKGCGLCAASCRSGAIRLKGFDDAQIFAMIESV
ncbi:FAD-dependent oxidoreductase [Syntrophobacter fumaroxidans]|uniref:4Fe-4S ferredoxin, iron-sulfur binding domain protein n=1 Tax=Syntrophobacter fumaroxidans (strain DSM 10017 / MPOB) TaxID=335543 RepID=A0LMJ3_SYNFM|nr:FAD-dependent oxidoreductase [Syntrophobacter fumaroxidans]ABK18645.1 4Fe-4S ferredoxin, iron-sulfur binding domain protein [Syntrophobacter fumaroxidans MPOB]ABK18687.1 4Fe-4S ferredoxin, iron-sulfur binding domain protein [Syntrophobacter fumaroxidans MPOB]